MHLRWKALGFRCVIYMRKVTKVHGINSYLSNNNHMIFLDYDNISLRTIKIDCKRMIQEYDLSSAHICSTGRPNSYHVYIFTRKSWEEARSIVASSMFVDVGFLQHSIIRKHFTLRLSEKWGADIKPIALVHSYISPTCTIDELESWVQYETGRKVEK